MHHNPQGHTYTETDTDGSRIATRGWHVLNDQNEGIIHAVSPSNDVADTDYTVYWSKLGVEVGLDIVVLDRNDFFAWMDYIYDKRSPYHKPDKKDCYDGPHMDEWLISDCKFFWCWRK